MKKTEDLSQTYLRFISLASAIRGLPSFPVLDAVEEQIFNRLAVMWGTGANITVLEAMQLGGTTSGTTVHRRLNTLRQKGLIELREDEADNRVKYILPTQIAKAHFEKLGKCMDMATRAQPT